MRKIDHKWRHSIGIVLITVILSLQVFYLLYCFNNRYTTKEEKAINGVLCVKEAEEEDIPIYNLSREWEFYPDVLLTPEDLKKNKENYYCRMISIGEYGGLEMGDGNRSPFGCGTYRLRISLPEKEQNYALELKEIFSAYCLYIDGKLVQEMGNPDAEHFEERIQNRLYTFRGSGTMEILIAVGNRRSAYSGIVYVPVFGTPFHINLQRGLSVFVNTARFCLCIFVLLFAFFMFWGARFPRAGLFGLLTMCVAGYTAYPLLHTYIAVKVQPWYGLEALFYFAMLPMVIFLQRSLLGKKDRFSAGMDIFTAVFAAAVFAAQMLCFGFQTAKGLYVISYMTEAVKWITAGYLILSAFFSQDKKYNRILLTGSVAYGCSLAADRIWSLYEPVWGGWFPEIGGEILVAVFGIVMWRELGQSYRFRLAYEESEREMENRLTMQKQHYEELNHKVEEIGKIRHDMRHHLRMIQTLLGEEQYEKLQEYVQKLSKEEIPADPLCYSKNTAMDAIIHYYAGCAEKEGIHFQSDIKVSGQTGISDIDLCKIFGNLLENAVDGAKTIKEEEQRFIRLTLRTRNGKLLIEVKNSYNNEIRRKDGLFFSTKHGGLGVGTASVMETVQRCGGYADFQAEKGVFQVSVFLPVSSSDSEENK